MICPMCKGGGEIPVLVCNLDNKTKKATNESIEWKPCPMGCEKTVNNAGKTGNSRLSGNEAKLSDFPQYGKNSDAMDGYDLTSERMSIREYYGIPEIE